MIRDGVSAVSDLRVPSLVELAEALSALSAGTVFSGRSAAQVWGIWIPRFCQVEVTTPAGTRGSRYTTSVQRRTVVAHRRILSDDDVVLHRGLPVTSLERTWLDLAAVLDGYDLVAAGDSALRAGAQHAVLCERVAQQRRLRGTRVARRAVVHLDARSRSRPEYNGAEHEQAARIRKDPIRLLDQQREDWEVRTYTAPHAYGRLHEVVDDVTTLLARRAPELLTAQYLGSRVTDFDSERRQIRRLRSS